MSAFAYLKHSETGGVTEVPDDPEVLADFAKRGWVKVTRAEAYPVDLAQFGTYDGDAYKTDKSEKADKSATSKKGKE